MSKSLRHIVFVESVGLNIYFLKLHIKNGVTNYIYLNQIAYAYRLSMFLGPGHKKLH